MKIFFYEVLGKLETSAIWDKFVGLESVGMAGIKWQKLQLNECVLRWSLISAIHCFANNVEDFYCTTHIFLYSVVCSTTEELSRYPTFFQMFQC